MNIKTISITILAIAVAGVVLGASLPLVASIGTETISVENEGAQWVRMAYVTDNSDYSVTIHDNGDDTVTITNGTDTQTGSIEDDIILYADSRHAVAVIDGDITFIGLRNDDTEYYEKANTGYDVKIARSGGTVTCTNRFGYNWGTPTWAYVPVSNGGYSSYAQGDIHRDSSQLVAVGSYAGVYCYNDYVAPSMVSDAGLVMDADVTSSMINSVRWALESDIDNVLDFNPNDVVFNPGIIDIQPIDIQPINPDDPGNMIMSVPTPSYTDGDWGYNLSGSDATIVSYSGAGGGPITVPATVGGYNVTAIGKGQYNTVFPDNLVATDLIISSGIQTINDDAFRNCSKFTGSLTIPNSITRVGNSAFSSANFTGTLTIPSSVTSWGSYAFAYCDNFTSLVLENGLSSIGALAFYHDTGLTGTLNIPLSVTSIGHSAFNFCTGLTGTLTLSNNITNIDGNAFERSGFTGTLVIPESLTTLNTGVFAITKFDKIVLPDTLTSIGAYAFSECTYITEPVYIPDNVTFIGDQAFGKVRFANLVVMSDATPHTNAYKQSTISNVLNLGSANYTTTSYGLNAQEVRTDIEASNYVASRTYSETVTNDGPVVILLDMLPLIMALGLVIACGVMISRRW